MEALLLRFDAPLMSFGGPAVDQVGVTEEFPARSMLAGLLANALGYDHRQAAQTQRLQERLRVAARRDRKGARLEDYQTVDLGQEPLRGGEWTTWGRPEKRAGAFSKDTHIRNRHYVADAVFTVAVTLQPTDEVPTLADIGRALQAPARPLFIGRKPCLPATPILVGTAQGRDLRSILEETPRVGMRGDSESLSAWWPAEEGGDEARTRLIPVTDDRDWVNQIHVGRRFVREGLIHPPEASDA